jgi:Fe-S cluster assembly ATP-binding protein
MLNIQNLCVSVDDTAIIKNCSLSIKSGTIHALMGPNGSGKSTLAHAIAGNPQFQITNGSLYLYDTDLRTLAPHERAKKGIFLSFQQPPAIPGLKVFSLLKEMYYAATEDHLEVELLHALLLSYCQQLNIDAPFLDRSCHDGFSGGEKKRLELLQILLLKPKLMILDEIDSGLDIDALKLVARVIEIVRTENPKTMVIIITHYQRLLAYIKPDNVHILMHGAIVKSGKSSLVQQLEQKGYDGYRANAA